MRVQASSQAMLFAPGASVGAASGRTRMASMSRVTGTTGGRLGPPIKGSR
jgi:hypothetical protein